MNTIYLIRHSITEAVERGLFYGVTDLPLVEAGVQFCESLRGTFDLPSDVSYATSGMLRAEQTLLHIFGDVPHEILPDMREMNVGELEMCSYEALKDNVSYQTWIRDAVGDFRIPGAETKNEMSARIMGCIRALAERPGNAIAIVCHGGVICNAMTNLFPTARAHFYEWSVQPCKGYAIHLKGGKAVSLDCI